MESQQIHCEYKQYNNKKKEYVYCKLPVCVNKNGLHYCGNHLPLGEEGPNGKMIKCDLLNQIIGKKIKKSLPKPISWMMECNRYWKIEDVACGGFHSLCLLKRVDSDEENKEKNNMKVVKKCIENLMI